MNIAPIRLAMWSGPRNLSTAGMYGFAARPDCAATDEAFDPAMLRRPVGPKPQDGVRAAHRSGVIYRSTGFAAPEGPLPDLPASQPAAGASPTPPFRITTASFPLPSDRTPCA